MTTITLEYRANLSGKIGLQEAVENLTDEYGDFDSVVETRSVDNQNIIITLTSAHGLFDHHEVARVANMPRHNVTITES